MTTSPLIAQLDLAPHPEGGWYRRTFASNHPVSTPGGERPAATVIHFLLQPGEEAAWHVVSSDEMWLWHGPGPVEVHFGGTGAEPTHTETHVLDAPGTPGVRQQVLVPAGVWQRSRPRDRDALVSCLVSPGFDFADWRLAADSEAPAAADPAASTPDATATHEPVDSASTGD
ncbi:cupin domain-containing protein [Mycetocola saprophilus]|uniref:cupin domain-containing protein n=1 Tax=Mycetocola saprophilus TaxID=76636 RepID=UPI003BF21CE1